MLDIVYHFDLVEPPLDVDGRWDKRAFKQVFQDWETGIGARGWNTVVLSNHDLGRIVSRFGDDAEHGSEQWRASATMLQTLVILMRGTPFLYQGDELGLVNAAFEDIDQLDDVWAKNLYDLRKARGASEAEAFAAALAVTRDHARTPFPWRADDTLGFSHEGVKPWLAPNPRHAALCAATQAGEPESPLLFAKALLRLRRSDAIWTDGALRIRPEPAAAAFVFERSLAGRTGIVALNLSGAPLDLAEPLAEEAPALANRFGPFDPRTLAPYEARVYAPETV
jgi:glycosidase